MGRVNLLMAFAVFCVKQLRASNLNTVNSLIATTSRKRPPPISDHFVNNRFVSHLNTVPRALS